MLHVNECLVRAVKGLQLQRVVRRVLPYAPKCVQRLSDKHKVHTRQRLVCEEELREKYEDALKRLQSKETAIGDYLEFGVYNGTSLACMYHVLEKLNLQTVRLFGFDSFEGLPSFAATDCGGHWRHGEFRCPYEFARLVLDEEGVDWSRVHLIKGFFAFSLTEDVKEQYEIQKAGVIMVDCDLYQSAKEALSFCASLIHDHCVIFFDDWFPLADRNMGEKRAFDEFLATHPTIQASELYDFKPWGKVFLMSRTTP
jgi:O-methyltransferase